MVALLGAEADLKPANIADKLGWKVENVRQLLHHLRSKKKVKGHHGSYRRADACAFLTELWFVHCACAALMATCESTLRWPPSRYPRGAASTRRHKPGLRTRPKGAPPLSRISGGYSVDA